MQLRGSLCALITPFGTDGGIDYVALDALLRWHARSSTSAVVLGGSTGESGALESDELVAMLQRADSLQLGELQVWAGVGAPATHKALRLGRALAAAGAQVLLAVTPYYCRPTQEGLYRHYRCLADETDAPIVLYNVPGRTGVDLQPQTVARLCEHPRVLGIKEAVGRPDRLQALLALRSPDFAILSGDDGSCAEWMMAGAAGVVSVAANVVPESCARLASLAGSDPAACTELDRRLRPLYAALESAPNPIPVKALLAHLGRCGPALRLPLTELESTHEAPLVSAYENARD